MNLVAAALSLLLHLALVAAALPSDEERQKQPKKNAPISVDLIAGDVELLPKEEEIGTDTLHTKCPHQYEGIGIKRNFGGMVTHVAKGWPADKAGILPGDVIEPWAFEPVNGFMEFEVIRNGRRTKMKLKTAQICFRDSPF